MNGIGKHAAFYRAYLPHDRSLIPVAVALGVIVALWLCLYFISEVQNPQPPGRKPALRRCSSPDLSAIDCAGDFGDRVHEGRCSWPADAQQRH